VDNFVILPALVATLFGLAVLIAVLAVVLHRSPARRRDALKALEILVRRRLPPP
jgi:hypothetical protein